MNERLDTWSILFGTLLNDGILGFIGSAAITKTFGALTMSITQAHVLLLGSLEIWFCMGEVSNQ